MRFPPETLRAMHARRRERHSVNFTDARFSKEDVRLGASTAAPKPQVSMLPIVTKSTGGTLRADLSAMRICVTRQSFCEPRLARVGMGMKSSLLPGVLFEHLAHNPVG